VAPEDPVVVVDQKTQAPVEKLVEPELVIHSPEQLVPHHLMDGEMMVVLVENIVSMDLAVVVVPVVLVKVSPEALLPEEEKVEQVFNYQLHSVIQ
tara:strand:- start:172 stop:456 length:285 start_codon:yes stop_codon:yes gene_type:complete